MSSVLLYCNGLCYVCDGKIDCPGGFDEINCMNHSCIGLFHCSMSEFNDEFNCELQNSKCPRQCFCLGFAVSCDYSFHNAFSMDEVVQNRTYASVIGNKLLWDFRCLQSWQTVQILILSEFELFDFCSSLISFKHDFHKVIRIILHKNSIALLRMFCFAFDSSILSLNFSSNMISFVEKFTFSGLYVLRVLDLSYNKINILNSQSFAGLINMIFLKINQNPLKFIHIHLLQELIQLKFIFTNNFRLCCIKPGSDIVCNSVIQWPASCKDLISNLVMSLSMWVIMLLVLILNIASIVNFIKIARKVRKKKKTISTFQIIAICLNISDFACGMYLALIVSFNIYFKGSYAINELQWRSHIACYMASHLFTFFQLSSLSTFGFMTLARLLVVIDPFKSRFRVASFTVKNLLVVFVSVSVTSVLLTGFIVYILEIKLLPNGLCSIFYDPMGHTVYRISAVGLSLFQLITCCDVILMYVVIYSRTRASFTHQTSGVEKGLQRKIIFQIVLITGSNIACWIPSSIIYIFSAFTYKFPIEILLYTTIYITPVNSKVNPIFIIFVNKIGTTGAILTTYSSFSYN